MREFQRTVFEVISQESPEAVRRIVAHLKEVIDDLERPAPPPPRLDGYRRFMKLQEFIEAVLYGTEEQVEALLREPELQELLHRP